MARSHKVYFTELSPSLYLPKEIIEEKVRFEDEDR